MPPSARLAGLAAVLVLLGGCAADPPASPPTGVDGLEVPTPAPDPDDFVARVDNPWLPLLPGSEWVYEDPAGGRTVTVSVGAGTHPVAGVDATEVTTVVEGERAGGAGSPSVEWYAQDRAGNVWLLGSAGEWEAGADGAEAGLAMPAEPRVGDGYEHAAGPGVDAAREEVLALDATATVPHGSFDDVLETEARTDGDAGGTERRLYARGVGLLLVEPLDRPGGALELVSASPG